MSKELWEKQTENFESQEYPILGAELTGGTPEGPKSWEVRLRLATDYSQEQMNALSEDVGQLLKGEPGTESPLESSMKVTITENEFRLYPDLAILRNVAEIQRLKNQHSDSKQWVLVSPPADSDDPEELVGESIRQLTGLLSGCDILEIQQGEGESFATLWGRLSVARLLATEGQMDRVPDVLSGAGLFEELSAAQDLSATNK